jgi:hypothetical protein
MQKLRNNFFYTNDQHKKTSKQKKIQKKLILVIVYIGEPPISRYNSSSYMYCSAPQKQEDSFPCPQTTTHQ